jgi:hypothetical protein
VLAAEFYFFAHTVSLAADWTPLSPEFIAVTVLFGLAVAVGFEQWPALHWGLVTRPATGLDDPRGAWARLRDFLADVPPTLAIGALGLGAVLAIWGGWIVFTFGLSADPQRVAYAYVAAPVLGVAGGTLTAALVRLSRLAALVTIVVPLLFVAANRPEAFDPLTAAPASLVFAMLLLPHWRRMTWRPSGYDILPRSIAAAFS